ncbi:hypothetical protein ICE98_00378 [Lactococcus lactis]|nr:hypothetical protein [Lactococcus lactis]
MVAHSLEKFTIYICEILVKNHERLYKDKSIQSREAIIRAVMDKTVE